MRYERDIRAADADREQAAEHLRRAHGEGRIDTREFEQRLEDCYAARTYGDLDAIVGDLPRRERPQRRSPVGAVTVAVALVALAFAWHAAWVVWLLLAVAFTRRCVGRRRLV